MGGIIDRTKITGAREKFMARRSRMEMAAGLCKLYTDTASDIMGRDHGRYGRIDRAALEFKDALEDGFHEELTAIGSDIGRIGMRAKMMAGSLPKKSKAEVRDRFFFWLLKVWRDELGLHVGTNKSSSLVSEFIE